MNAVNKVTLNTGILYIKMLITMGISLYSTRLVLNELGASDYGIFNLVAGVIAMLSFLNAAMTASTQRYLSFHQGTGDFEMQKKIFINSWILHIGIGIIVVALLVALVPFLFNGFLNIPADRIPLARTIYYFMSISVFFTIISVPFTASLNAHENMVWIAIVNIIEAFLKLAIALSLLWFIQSERLVVYGILMAALSVITFSLYAGFCLKRYKECSVKNYQIDKPLVKELGSFAGWNMFGSLCVIGRVQGLALILNLFFGTVINAAYGIANQVSSQLSFFSAHMLQALNPQIMKSEGMGNRERMLNLSMMASKFGFFFLSVIAIPCIFEMDNLLRFWLKDVPENTIVFCQLILVAMIVNQLTVGLQSAFQATGNIKIYQIIVGSMILFNLPTAYVLLYLKYPVYSIFISYIGIELVACVSRALLLKKEAGLSLLRYMNKVVVRILFVVPVPIIICLFVVRYVDFDFRFIITGILTFSTYGPLFVLVSMDKDEKKMLRNAFRNIKKKIGYGIHIL